MAELTLAEYRALEVLRAVVQDKAETPTGPDPLSHLGWKDWHSVVAPQVFTHDYHAEQARFWEWASNIKAGQRPDQAFVALWPRGFAKSSAMEVACARWACTGDRRYVLYVSATADQADKHLTSIAEILESPRVSRWYPKASDRAVNKYGTSRGWRGNRLRTASGFTIDSLGLDTASRGAKADELRPDMIVFDDIDHQHDTPRAVDKKISTITQSILPTLDIRVGGAGVAQNLTHGGSIAAKLADGSAEFLADRIVSGPFPAIRDLELELRGHKWVVTGGNPEWAGMDLAACQAAISMFGLAAFTIETQQDITEQPGALWTRDMINQTRISLEEMPPMERIVVGIDPNQTGQADDAGVVVFGVATVDGVQHGYVLADGSQLSTPSEWRNEAASLYLEWNAGMFVVEKSGLGEHAELTVRGAALLRDRRGVIVHPVGASMGKRDRSRPVAQMYREGLIHHVGGFPYLEGQMTGWNPEVSALSPGGVDALTHAATHLMLDQMEPQGVAAPGVMASYYQGWGLGT